MIAKAQQFSKDLKIQKLNYKDSQLVDDDLLASYLEAFESFDLNELTTRPQQLAFWINMYNGLTNYWIITKKIKKSMMEQPHIFFIPKAQIGKYRFSLDDIEHGILRQNTRHRRKLIRQFPFWDDRKELVMQTMDYRIHFALNCGAESCPALAFYSENHLEDELDLAERTFREEEFLVDDSNRVINCSQLYIWYKKDFNDVYLNDPKYHGYRIEGKKYDWTI